MLLPTLILLMQALLNYVSFCVQSTPKPTGVPYGTADEIEQEAPISDFQLRAQHAFESEPAEVSRPELELSGGLAFL